MTKPEISVIIPVYKTEKYLPQCLDSLLNQTFRNWQAVCVNDGSPDNAQKVLTEYAQKDSRFAAVSQKNAGVGAARNTGLKVAEGEYVMFMDSDDYMHPQCLELALKAMKLTGADICQFGFAHVGDTEKPEMPSQNEITGRETFTAPLADFLRGKLKKSVLVWNKIYKAKLAQSVKFVSVAPGEDDLYTFETLAKAEKFAKISNALYYYRVNPDSVMHTMPKDGWDGNRQKVTEFFADIAAKLPVSGKTAALLRKYMAEKMFFKSFVIKPLTHHVDAAELEEVTAQLAEFEKKGLFDVSSLRLRYKIIYRLLQKRLYTSALLLTGKFGKRSG